MVYHVMIFMFIKEQPGNQTDPGTWREATHWSSERRNYETNEETNTPFRDGISDRPVEPVKAGKPSL